jgi:hypothetical protein
VLLLLRFCCSGNSPASKVTHVNQFLLFQGRATALTERVLRRCDVTLFLLDGRRIPVSICLALGFAVSPTHGSTHVRAGLHAVDASCHAYRHL